jgi:small subunit ribosomal protein S7
MPRKGPVPKRPILPDPKFNSKVLSRFINKVMLQGKKSVAERICYSALEIVETKSGRDPMDIFTFPWKSVPIAVRRWRCAG